MGVADLCAKGHRFSPSTLYAPGEEANETNGCPTPIGKTVSCRHGGYVATNEPVEQIMRGDWLRGKTFLTVSAGDEGRTVKLVH
ncbi:hypothetical protein EXU85_21890 [Spirosoma sp. KCTC 42546]|uniref:hypothetical protein n=1 Tax=Spirosoma sp. KCTC 42546 TaxID=2520506 RepID=UPI00115B576A|nr:hypothetical protein [Spirosoma sp. KCTC 42546]QDK81121.1 hypothetical protein EXU85_21890 [Spirosoma sp. KCTC 42546]